MWCCVEPENESFVMEKRDEADEEGKGGDDDDRANEGAPCEL